MENVTQFKDSSNQQMPNNNLPLAIVATVLGCFGGCFGAIFGIIAIVNSTYVKKRFEAGDFLGAQSASKNAKTFAIVAIVIAVIIILLQIIFKDDLQAYQESLLKQLEEAQGQQQ